MAKHYYSVIKHKCPRCGEVLKRESEADRIVLFWILTFLTGFTFLLWAFAMVIIDEVFKCEISGMGSPIINCPNCDLEVNIGTPAEWGELTREEKQNWAFRKMLWFCYFLGGTSLALVIFPLIFGAWKSNQVCAISLLGVSIFFIIVIIMIYFRRRNLLEKDYILVSPEDYELIQESWDRLNKTNPDMYETEIIKISGKNEIIYPKKKHVDIDPQNKNLEINKEEETQIINNSKNQFDETIESSLKKEAESKILIFYRCHECGNQVFEDDEKCYNCGAKNLLKEHIEKRKNEKK